ncbi:MAG: DUF3108 domain-containing protein [Gammaproteobacteria bacterium]|nr:DUF3108 domain-containing protein [Gammaproteobacteria bacterium]
MISKINLPLFRLSIILISSLHTILFSCNVFAVHALPEFSARYAMQKSAIKLAEAHYQLSYTDTGYKFNQNTKLSGIASTFSADTITATSYVDEDGDNLLLRKHSHIQTGHEKNRDENFDILWRTPKNTLSGTITGVFRGKKVKLTIDSEIWDILSFQIPLMIEAGENVKEYPYKAILNGEIDSYNFVLTSIKKITFSNKEYTALQMVRTDPKRNRQLHIWLLPELHNIPVIIENYREGKEHSRMQLESVSFNNKETYTDREIDKN